MLRGSARVAGQLTVALQYCLGIKDWITSKFDVLMKNYNGLYTRAFDICCQKWGFHQGLMLEELRRRASIEKVYLK